MLATHSKRWALLLAVLFAGCSIPGAFLFGQIFRANSLENAIAKFEKEVADVPEIDVVKLMEIRSIDAKAVVLIDVRDANERKVSLIPGAITLAEYESNPIQYASKTVVTYCTVGYRSAKTARELRHQGVNAFNLRGGIVGWTQIGGQLVSESGEATQRVHTYGRAWNFVPKNYIAVW